VLTDVCQRLDLRGLVRIAATCKRFRHGDGGMETVELPTKSLVVTALRELAFHSGAAIPSTRPVGCSESWVAYLARSVRQRRCRDAPPIAAGFRHSLFLDATGRLLACGKGAAVGHGDANAILSDPIPVAAMAGIRVRSIAAGHSHSLALGWDGRVFAWGRNIYGEYGELGLGDKLPRPAPALVESLEGVLDVAAGSSYSYAVAQSGDIFNWGFGLLPGPEDALRPIAVKGSEGVRLRRLFARGRTAFGIGEDGGLFSWGDADGVFGLLGHGEEEPQISPKRVEALRGVRISSVAVGMCHALALAEDGLVYVWGVHEDQPPLGSPHVESELLPKPVEALRGVRVSSIAAARAHSYAVADTGELWA
jgi:hypothetical protein